jgi:hypothetical protein
MYFPVCVATALKKRIRVNEKKNFMKLLKAAAGYCFLTTPCGGIQLSLVIVMVLMCS